MHLNNVIAGAGFSQRVVGYVDDSSGVYDLDQRRVGSVDVLAANEEHVVRAANGAIAGFVGSAPEAVSGGYWHKVYDTDHTFVGLVDNASEIAGSDGQAGSVIYNEGNAGKGWLLAGAALLLLIKRA